jgi:hypothetical protein
MLDQIKAESGDTVIALARLCLRHDKIMERLDEDMLKSKPGSKTRLDFLRAIGKEDREHTELIQSLGYFPRIWDCKPKSITNLNPCAGCLGLVWRNLWMLATRRGHHLSVGALVDTLGSPSFALHKPVYARRRFEF